MECVYGISNTVGFLVGTALIEVRTASDMCSYFILHLYNLTKAVPFQWWPDAIPFFISGGLMFLVAPFILLRSPAKCKPIVPLFLERIIIYFTKSFTRGFVNAGFFRFIKVHLQNNFHGT